MNDYAVTPELKAFLQGRPPHTVELFDHFVHTYGQLGTIRVLPAKTMIGIANEHKRIAWITQLGRNFIHVIFPFRQAYEDNLCFQKIAQVPGTAQFNHHFRMYATDDLNDEVIRYMILALNS
jgi:hypothetical protein